VFAIVTFGSRGTYVVEFLKIADARTAVPRRAMVRMRRWNFIFVILWSFDIDF